jgi:1-acyl-sn-glycerol-3-phosphate acyltransferase
VKKAVLVAAPHTSNWDLPFSLALSFVLDIKISWVGKHTLFQPPLGTFMRAIGGVPVDRRGRNDAVKSIAKLFEGRDELMLIVPPEGTRGRAKRWKTGFYYIALEAKVPIVPVAIVGAWECWPKTRLLPRPGRIRLEFGRVIRPEEIAALDDRTLVAECTQRLTELDAQARSVRAIAAPGRV